MKKTKNGRLLKSSVGAAILAAAVLAPVANANTLFLRGGNWADRRDNFVNGRLVLSGLSTNTGTGRTRSVANALANRGRLIGVNAIRIPINVQTIASSAGLARFRAQVEGIQGRNRRVIVAFWEGEDRNGRLENQRDWETMWRTVDGLYRNNNGVYFEPFNEPHGYNTRDHISIQRDALNVIRKGDSRILVAGRGFSDNVRAIGGNSAFRNTLFSQHLYSWFGRHTSESRWTSELDGRVRGFRSRTIVTEAGATMTDGTNYAQRNSTGQRITYFRATTNYCRTHNMGLVYWPLWRDGDSFRLFRNTTDGSITNQRGLDQLRRAWRF